MVLIFSDIMNQVTTMILTLLGLNSVSKVTKRVVQILGQEIESLIVNTQCSCIGLYEGEDSFKLSSGINFLIDLENWMDLITEKNVTLDFKTKLLEKLGNTDSKLIKYNLKNITDTLQQKIAVILFKDLEIHLGNFVKQEIKEIQESLKGECFFNLTNEKLSHDLTNKLDLGRKFTPYVNFNTKQELESFENEIGSLFKNFLKHEYNIKFSWQTNHLNKGLRSLRKSSLVKNKPIVRNNLFTFETTYNKIRKQFKHELKLKVKRSTQKHEKFERTFSLGPDKILIEADKNVGYACIYIKDLLDQYEKINCQQHFGLVKITEKWYLNNITLFLSEAQRNIPPELSKIILKSDFAWKEGNSEIGVLRLQPKVLKLKTINHENITHLTSRGIKSSMKDPIKIVQKILDKVFNHLLFYIQEKFQNLFGINSPSVTGVKEAIDRIKQTKTGEWGRSIELEGDFSDLYSNCNEELLIECVSEGCRYARLHESSISYIRLLIKCIMKHSYFKEPLGIFRTLKGFSMGDCSAARGSEIILAIYEIKMFTKLARNNLLKNVFRFLRFRDDVSIHISGNRKDMFNVVKIIGNGYPASIKFNMESKIIHGKFLNIRIYNNPNSNKPFTTVLRKSNNKYNIIPPNSNTHPRYKRMAGLSYFNTARMHTTTRKELENQYKVINTILKGKGFNQWEINKMQKHKKSESKEKKIFLTKTVYNETSERHKYVIKIFKTCNIDKNKYYKPMEIPGKKLEQMIFTIKKMRNKLKF